MSLIPSNETLPAPLLLCATEVAGLLGIGKTKVYELIAIRELHPVHIGRSCRIPYADVEDYVRRLRLQVAA